MPFNSFLVGDIRAFITEKNVAVRTRIPAGKSKQQTTADLKSGKDIGISSFICTRLELRGFFCCVGWRGGRESRSLVTQRALMTAGKAQ